MSEVPIMFRQEQSPDTSQRVEKGGTASRAEVHNHPEKTLAVIALVIAAVFAGICIVLLFACYGLWNRYDLLKINYDDIKTELIARGMNPHPHLPSESP